MAPIPSHNCRLSADTFQIVTRVLSGMKEIGFQPFKDGGYQEEMQTERICYSNKVGCVSFPSH
jgi:hypothetical protein